MAGFSYAGLALSPGAQFSEPVREFQQDLRRLGYFAGPVDGLFGNGTSAAVSALTYDLVHNDGSGSDGRAPVAVKGYARGNLTGQADAALSACMAAMLEDASYPKLPAAANAAGENARALAAIRAMLDCAVPVPFLIAILSQESGLKHYREPSGGNADNFVTVGLDRNDARNPTRITSRGYGLGQYTLFHHPPTEEEMRRFILDPVGNLGTVIAALREKFDHWVVGEGGKCAEDRVAELGRSPLLACRYESGDARFQTDCANCLKAAPAITITAGVTPWFKEAPGSYAKTQYHRGSYANVPQRDRIGCDWPYAARRFNGGGVNSYDYQAEVLLKVLKDGELEVASKI